ncbi:hypothetical protein NBO_28g0054 [Nosema bombycis CQ1]|uniref:Uncharacterized protein n=1 Tax=Nosema bombycis (strain CQ1 / CVCC 102059) TaxID=578461 RepID=R0MJN8_NOSB1|nr:hypothetical protein NBO_28g0054 [Nosema bombycis CQ1]|eukprot:EOB14415.1 hypothetical protein NBO_28g0054 [Nosema bombycis CQ1]
MKNNKSPHSFNSLRKSPVRKKMKVVYESNISFWDNVKDTNCEEDTRSESDFTELSFTSFEIEHSKKSSKNITSVKFIIREIEREEDCVR